jgi:flavin reductase (DIM6/NTAB) family NADH-FMN oxidoreductase RutF
MPLETTAHSVAKEAIARLPSGRFLMTAAFGESRNGMIVTQVQKCADIPPTITVAVRKGHALSPLIRDSGTFALCEIAETDLVLSRLFVRPSEIQGEDPFLGHVLVPETQDIPVPTAAASWVICELIRHLDIEADHEIYIGRVIRGEVLEKSETGSKNGTRPRLRRSSKTSASGINGQGVNRKRPGIDGKSEPSPVAENPEESKKTKLSN